MGDVRLIREALRSHGLDTELTLCRDGEEMLRHVGRIEAGETTIPDVVLLDLNLPRRNGHMVLAEIRESARCAKVPVIIVTSSNAPKDREAASQLGATRYFHKPSEFDAFMLLGRVVREVMGLAETTQ